MATELDWSYSISKIPETGLSGNRHATADQRSAIAAALDLIGCNRLDARFKITHLRQGRFLLEGTVAAEVVQSCVVTLDPVESKIVEPFEVEFRPSLSDGGADFDALESRDIEPLEGSTIPVGRIVYEHLASAIDPYPRKEGAELEQPAPREDQEARNPFAVLKQLKSRE